MNPIPWLPPNISPTTMPINPSATPWRTPVKMNGTDPGNASVVKICQSDAQYARAARSRSRSIFLTPATVFTRIGKNAEMNTMKIFDQIPMPNQMIIMGTMAMRGVAYRAFRNGSKSSRTLRYQPMITPMTTPAASASANPMAKLVPLYAMSLSSVPCCNPNTNCLAIADGPLKNKGEIFPADHSACYSQMVIAT